MLTLPKFLAGAFLGLLYVIMFAFGFDERARWTACEAPRPIKWFAAPTDRSSNPGATP